MRGIKNVCILGGTHGNELSGIHLVKKWQSKPALLAKPSFSIKTCISNPEAVKENQRYIDVDLNRSFSPENFAAKITPGTHYEVKRARELKSMLSDSGELGKCDLLLDLHNTTANTKVCLIHDKFDSFTMQMLHYVCDKLPRGASRCLSYDSTVSYHHSLSLSQYGFGLEVGPQPHGVLRADVFNLMEEAVKHCMNFVENFNSGVVFSPVDFEIFKAATKVSFPRDAAGEINGMIHPKLQDNDWSPLSSDDPVFLLFDGGVLRLRDVVEPGDVCSGAVYPAFVNEASYCEKNIAFYLAKKHTMRISELKKDGVLYPQCND